MADQKNGFIRVYDDVQTKKNLDYTYFLINGKIEGEYKSYYSNGRLHLICYYKDGKIEGKFVSYYVNGNIREISNYVNNQKQGVCKIYYDDG